MVYLLQMLLYVAGIRQRLLLYTIFSLSMNYKSVDISLLVACGLLPTLYELAGVCTPLQGLVQPVRGKLGQAQLNTVLRVASYRLIQIVSLTTRWVLSSDNLVLSKLVKGEKKDT